MTAQIRNQSSFEASRARRPQAVGMLPLLQALTAGNTDLDVSRLEASAVRHALESGLGAILSHTSAAGRPSEDSVCTNAIRAADLTARLLTADKRDAMVAVLAATAALGLRPILLKGIATARFYPAPHLRTMGDMDLLVTDEQQPALEVELRRLGYQQTSHEPPTAFIRRHHSMPFWHPERRVWIEVHTRLHPYQHPLAEVARFLPAAVRSELTEMDMGGENALVMNNERQLVYTSTRWAESFDRGRGAFPMLDAALLLRRHGGTLDWDRIRAIVDGCWATTAVRLMLSNLTELGMAEVPGGVLDWFRAHDRHSSRLSVALVRRLTMTYVVEGRPYGTVATTKENVGAVWGSMVRPAAPWLNIVRTPYSIGGAIYRTLFPSSRR